MLGILAQTESANAAAWLERFPTDEILVMFIVAVVFTTALLVVIAWCVTSTIRTICVAAANARMAEQLARQGMPGDQIQQLVRANSRRRFPWSFGHCGPASRWREPNRPVHAMYGKPAGAGGSAESALR